MIHALKVRRHRREIATQLCAAVSARAREPVFFEDFGVADSIDGRFDLLVLHAWLVLDRLQQPGEERLAQTFVDALFTRFDEALREQGAGDMGMSRRIKRMAGAFYGRLQAYSESGDRNTLAQAIWRNLYRGGPTRVEHAALLANYIDDARRRLVHSRPDRGEVEFGPIPAL